MISAGYLFLAACGPTPGAPPVAVLSAPAYVDLGKIADLDGTQSTDPDHDIASFRFTIADGSSAATVTAGKLAHVFKVSGMIEVELEVIDIQGFSDTARTTVSVRRP
jgi:hypothetical protein